MRGVLYQISRCIRSHFWSFLLLFSIVLYLYILSNYSLWSSVGIPRLKASFADMQAVLSASDAYFKGFNPYIENPYDPLGRVHVYPRPWLWLGGIGITLAHSDIAALVVGAIFFLLSVVILKPSNFKEFMISAMLLLSPAVLLGVERGNNDLIIFIMLGVAAFMIRRNIRILNYTAYLCLYLASFLKIYPIASFAMLPRIIQDLKKFWILVLFSAFIFGAYAFFLFPDFEYLITVAPKPHGRFTFGAAILFEWLLNTWPVNTAYVILAIITAIFLAFLLSSKTDLTENRKNSISTIFFLIGSLSLIFCFFTNTNYDYRCIFFILTLPWLFEFLKCKNTPVFTKRYVKLLLLLLPIVVWNETIITLIGSKVGAPGISILKLIFMLNFYLVEHFCTWIVMTILLAFCIELLKAQVREKMMAPLGKILR